jgi:PST family polysaccharide transporter
MFNLSSLLTRLQQKLTSQFIRNIGWLGAGELVIRIFRLVTTILLARFLSPYDYGLAAIVLATNEFIMVFSRVGLDEKLIQIEEHQLEAFAIAAYWLNWVIYGLLFIVQCLVALGVAWFYHDHQLILPICAMSIVYLMIPIAAVQSTLIVRENRLRISALTNTLQVSTDNVLTAIFAVLGLGMWAIVLPKVLVAPIWVGVHYVNHPWRPHQGFTSKHWGDLLGFGKHLLGVELLKTLRNNLDYLIVGRFVGVKELGVYYFAFNAGLGISLSFINAINTALLPHLCSARSQWSEFQQRYFNSLKTISWIIVPLVILQSSLAPFYVPLIFGTKWIPAIPVLILICLSAIPRPYADAASQLLLAVNQPRLSLVWSVGFTAVFSVGLLMGVQWQAIGVAVSVLLTHWLFLPLFTLWATRYVFRQVQA